MQLLLLLIAIIVAVAAVVSASAGRIVVAAGTLQKLAQITRGHVAFVLVVMLRFFQQGLDRTRRRRRGGKGIAVACHDCLLYGTVRYGSVTRH